MGEGSERGGEDKWGRIGGGDNEQWEAKPSEGDEWGKVAGGGRQNQVREMSGGR